LQLLPAASLWGVEADKQNRHTFKNKLIMPVLLIGFHTRGWRAVGQGWSLRGYFA
jgi:hypothetical protein